MKTYHHFVKKLSCVCIDAETVFFRCLRFFNTRNPLVYLVLMVFFVEASARCPSANEGGCLSEVGRPQRSESTTLRAAWATSLA